MFESDHPWELNPNLYQFTISDTTVQAFSPETNTFNNSREVCQARLLERNPHLMDALEDLIDAWHLDDDTIEAFEDGFTLGHALLSYEADVLDTSMPVVAPETIKNFMAALQMDWETGPDYCQDRFRAFKDHNSNTYLDALSLGIPKDRLRFTYQAGAFVLGGLNAHDLLWQQRFVDDALKVYKRNVHETSMPLE